MRLALLGDIALFGSFSRIKNQNLDDNLKEVADYLSTFDYVVGNLETPFSLAKRTFGAKSAYIFAEPEDVSILQILHINAVTLANNHMFDFGIEGYELTKKLLKRAGIEWFGGEGKVLRIKKDDNKIAFSGFCCFTSNPLRCVRCGDYGINAYNIGKVRKVLKKYHNQGILNIVSVHAGLEHVNYPAIEHVRAARLLADVCPFVYYGHHPHVIQGVEDYKGSLIAHSLGNFCFDDVYIENSKKPLVKLTDNNRTGMILELDIEDNKVKNWREKLIYISKEGKMKLLDTKAEVESYNEKLKHCEEELVLYSAMRKDIIEERLSERKSKRTIMWYLKRLRPRYVQIILNARNNVKAFHENVLKYIN